MKRFLIFLLVGPFLGTALVSAAMAVGIDGGWWLHAWSVFAIMIGVDAKSYIVIMGLLAWLSDVVFVHWGVKQRTRMIVLGGAVALLTIGLQRYSTMLLVAGLICGAVAAFCVWLSDRMSG